MDSESQSPLRFLLWGTVFLLAMALLWPSQAWSVAGAAISMAMVLMGVLALLLHHKLNVQTSIQSVAICFVAALWTLDWHWMLGRAPVPTFGLASAMSTTLALLFLLVGVLASTTENAAKGALRILSLMLGLSALHGILQVFGPAWMPGTFARAEQQILANIPESDSMREGLLHAVRSGRASGTVGAPNIYASLMVVAFALNGALAWGATSKPWRIAHGSIAALAVLALILSESRGGVLAFAAVALLLALLIAGRRTPAPVLARRGLIAGVLFALLVVGFLATIRIMEVPGGRWLGATGMTQRFNYWKTAVAIWQEAPLFGRGPGAFEVLYMRLRQPDSDETRLVHSWFFDHLASVGILGTLLFIGIILLSIYTIISALTKARSAANPEAYMLAVATTCAIAGLLLHGLVEYSLSFREVLCLLFLMIGLTAGLATHQATTSASKSLRILLLLALAASLPAIQYRQMVPMKAGLAREEAYALLEMSAHAEDIQSAAERAVELEPNDYRNHLLVWHVARRMGDPAGIASLHQARELNPWSANLAAEEAAFLWETGNREAAIAQQQEAVELNPQEIVHHLTLAGYLFENNQADAAWSVFEGCKGLRILTPAERRLFDKTASMLE